MNAVHDTREDFDSPAVAYRYILLPEPEDFVLGITITL